MTKVTGLNATFLRTQGLSLHSLNTAAPPTKGGGQISSEED